MRKRLFIEKKMKSKQKKIDELKYDPRDKRIKNKTPQIFEHTKRKVKLLMFFNKYYNQMKNLCKINLIDNKKNFFVFRVFVLSIFAECE